MLMQKHTKINFSEFKCAFPFDINLPLSTDEAVSKVHFNKVLFFLLYVFFHCPKGKVAYSERAF